MGAVELGGDAFDFFAGGRGGFVEGLRFGRGSGEDGAGEIETAEGAFGEDAGTRANDAAGGAEGLDGGESGGSIRGEFVEGDDGLDAEALDDVEVAGKIGVALGFDGTNGADENNSGGREAGGGHDEVEEFFGAEVRTEAGLVDDVVGVGEREALGEDAGGAVGDVGKGTGVDENRGAVGGLGEVGVESIAEEGEHGADGLEVAGENGLSGTVVGDGDVRETVAEIVEAGGEGEDGHDFAGGGDDELGGVGLAVAWAFADGDVAEGAVVHIEGARPEDLGGVDGEGVAVEEMSVEERGEEIVGGGDGVEVAGEMEVDRLGGNDLSEAAARGAAFRAEDRAEGGLADGGDGAVAELAEGLSEAEGGDGFPFAVGGGRDGSDEDEFAAGGGGRRGEGELGEKAAVRDQVRGGEAEFRGGGGEGTGRQHGKCPRRVAWRRRGARFDRLTEMRRRELVLGALAPREKMNVLFLPVDDWRRAAGCFGDRQVKTPNIDRLAARGVRFAGAQANYASCLPSRISFLSGWYPERTGVITFTPKPRDRQLKDVVYLPEHFRANGYTTARLDKVFHIGGDEAKVWDITEEPLGRVTYTPSEIEHQNLRQRVLEEGRFAKCKGETGVYAKVDAEDGELIDGLKTKRVDELLGRFARSKEPFFLAAGLRRPHLPLILPKKYFDLYPPEQISLPPQPPNYDAATWLPREEQRKVIAHYYAATTFMDARVGEILASLERHGLARNTLVVLFGDQGYALGERENHYGKGTLTENSYAVPLIVAGPGIRQAGKMCRKIVELIDLYPTLADWCGLGTPRSGLQGRSLRPLLENVNAAWEERAVGAFGKKDYTRPGLTVRTGRYRYSEDEEQRPVNLFDYKTDPYEWSNRVNDPALAKVQAQLASYLRQERN